MKPLSSGAALITLFGIIGLIIYWILPVTREKETNLFEIPLTTPAPVDTQVPFTIAAAGDIACSDMPNTESSCQQQATASVIERINPEFVVPLGDLQYNVASLENLIGYYDLSWGVFRTKTKPVVGNHEYGIAGAEGYFDYFNGQGQFSGPAGDRDKGYYTFQKDQWKFFVLNSNCWAVGGCGINSPQYSWLTRELTQDRSICQMAVFHHPLFSSGLHGSEDVGYPLWQILYIHKVDVVLNGHDHHYERFAPQDPDGKLDTTNGIRQFIIGTGGRNLYPIKSIANNSEVRIPDTFGVARFTLLNHQYTWQFIGIDNQVLDTGDASCH